MYNNPYMYPNQYPYYVNATRYNYGIQPRYWNFPNESRFYSYHSFNDDRSILFKDYGTKPFVININEATKQNNTYRTAIWTGTHLQTTLMSIDVGDDIGLEMHPDVDQFLRIEQ